MRIFAAIIVAVQIILLVVFPLWAWFLASIILGAWFFTACFCRVASIADDDGYMWTATDEAEFRKGLGRNLAKRKAEAATDDWFRTPRDDV